MARQSDRNIHPPHPRARRRKGSRDDSVGATPRERARTADSSSRLRFLLRASPSLFGRLKFRRNAGFRVEPIKKAMWTSGSKGISEALGILCQVPIQVAC